MRRSPFSIGWAFSLLMVAGCVLRASALSDDHKPSELIGTWRGTSTCSDRIAAPACRDEVVVYDFTAGPKPETVHWKADKLVNGQREPMGEMDLAYDAQEKCWASESSSPRVRVVWCVAVDGAHLTGTGRLLPGKEIVRRIDARKEDLRTAAARSEVGAGDRREVRARTVHVAREDDDRAPRRGVAGACGPDGTARLQDRGAGRDT